VPDDEGGVMVLDDELTYVWFVLAAMSVAVVAWDNFVGRNPEMTVMKWGWVLVTLYMGPIGLALYVLSDMEPRPGEHEAFVKPLWKQGVGSTVHCVAGDATGIIVTAAVVTTLGLPMWLDLILEYTAGFLVGLFVFQALFMRSMSGSYGRALRSTLIPEWLSMNTMAGGMFFVMTLLMMGRDMRSMNPTEPQFWFVMSMAVIVGFATAYPINLWMVGQNLKHGLMTQRPDGAGDQQSPAEAQLQEV
jgi:manganese oxidase